jgi:hypothetical protein
MDDCLLINAFFAGAPFFLPVLSVNSMAMKATRKDAITKGPNDKARRHSVNEEDRRETSEQQPSATAKASKEPVSREENNIVTDAVAEPRTNQDEQRRSTNAANSSDAMQEQEREGV